MSQLGWIDFSPEHREKVNAVIDILTPEGMVDELGIGTIRDALADLMFPGISTIQTRAKYFFYIPYIIKKFAFAEDKKNTMLTDYLRKEENELMWKLSEAYNYEEGHGVVGISKKRGEELVRRASSIYWNGLRTFRIIKTKYSLAQYLESINNRHKLTVDKLMPSDDGQGDDLDCYYDDYYKIGINDRKDWDRDTKIDLTVSEAEVLYDKITRNVPQSLLAHLLVYEDLRNNYVSADDFGTFAKRIEIGALPAHLQKIIKISNDFSEIMYGAHIRYNYLIQEKFKNAQKHSDLWDEWQSNIRQKCFNFEGFSAHDLFIYSSKTWNVTQIFVSEWIAAIKSSPGHTDIERLDMLVRSQEINNKGHKARLKFGAEFENGEWFGLQRLTYRFSNARTIVNDIYNPVDKPC